jgi:hypothetical protein
MKADLKAGNPVYDAMTDLFKFHRDYGMPEKEDRYWAKLIEAAGALNDKYKDTIVGDIVVRHLVSTMAMLDKMAKEGEKV